ncbi:alpha/beta fold hydrolase [Streptomyces sp. enrichment culture]|uniref:epoxide hydrolase family protein n=1 Tax=Streptomyces sp. enrichment culture TaxID=1795815 RepID=UPI003F555266
MLDYWATGYDWRKLEQQLNELGQFRTTIDGLGIHFLHVRSPGPDATPLLLLHGWPGSFLEFLKTVGPLTEHGFHLVIPSMPGYGFSDQPTTTGWDPDRIARAYGVLMQRLGYDSYLAQGGDWGGVVATRMGAQRPAGLRAIHINFPEFLAAPPIGDNPTPAWSSPRSNRAAASSPSSPDTTSYSAPGRRPLATPSPTPRPGRPLGSTRSSSTGPGPRPSPATRSLTTSPCTGSPAPPPPPPACTGSRPASHSP